MAMAKGVYGNYAATAILVAIVSVIAFGAVFVSAQQSTTASQTSAFTIRSCDPRPFATSVASQVEQNPRFIAASASGSFWLMVYAGNETGFVSNATYTRQIHDTALNFYSFASSSASGCDWNGNEVVNVLFVKIPINSDGSYNFAGLTAYYEPYHANGTTPAGVDISK